jgi:hypothetical protein
MKLWNSIGMLALAVVLGSSLSSQAQQVYWKKQDMTINVGSSGRAAAQYNQIFQKVVMTHNYYECGYYQEPEVEVRTGTCYETKCEGGAGRSAAWDAFFSAKKEEKATKLAAAIKGVGKASAEALVSGGYFSSKPRSWEAFKTQIIKAASDRAITEQVKTLVLSTYRSENISNLGYASGNCTSTPYPCQEVVVIREGGYVSQTCDDPREILVDQKAMNYNVQVENAVLLPSETEKLVLTLSGAPEETSMGTAYYNNYQLTYLPTGAMNSYSILVNGTSRKQVAVPRDALQSVTLIPNGANAATMQVAVSPAVLPAVSTESLVISYEVKTCKVGWLGACGIGWDKKETFSGSLTQAISTFPLSATLAPGRKGLKMEVDVKIYKQNSKYHNAAPVSMSSKTIKLN